MATACTVKDVSPHEFVRAYSAHLKRSGKIELPHWTDLVKTATFKELAPYDPDWYYVRAASMVRKIYLRQGTGVGGFQKIYGGRKRNGCRPPHFCKSSGSVARHILQQLEKMNIIEIDPNGRPAKPTACTHRPSNQLYMNPHIREVVICSNMEAGFSCLLYPTHRYTT